MKKIIKETLAKKKTKKEKISYLLYAYKEKIAGGLLAVLLVALVGSSYLNKTETAYSIGIVVDTSLTSHQQKEIEHDVNDYLSEQAQFKDVDLKQVSYQFANNTSSSDMEVFTTKVAGGAVNAIFLKDSLAADFIKDFGTGDLQSKEVSFKDAGSFVVQEVKTAEKK